MTYTNEEYQVYLKVKHALLLEDARNYARDYLENSDEKCLDLDDITEEQFESIDFDELVNQFEERTDYYDPTYEVWQNIVSDYLEDYDFEGGAE